MNGRPAAGEPGVRYAAAGEQSVCCGVLDTARGSVPVQIRVVGLASPQLQRLVRQVPVRPGSAPTEGRVEPGSAAVVAAVGGLLRVLDAAGPAGYLVAAPGVVCTAGRIGPDRPWQVGVRHPLQADELVALLSGPSALVSCVAPVTPRSGVAARWLPQPRSGPAPGPLAVTVVGPALVPVARAARRLLVAPGPAGASLPAGSGALVIDADNAVHRTTGWACWQVPARMAGGAAGAVLPT